MNNKSEIKFETQTFLSHQQDGTVDEWQSSNTVVLGLNQGHFQNFHNFL